MNNWRSLPSPGGLIGIGLTIVAGVGFGVLLLLTLVNALAADSAGANPGTFLLGLAALALLLVTLLLAWRSWCFFRLRYYLDRNAITIDLGDSRQIIPLANIQEVVTASELLLTLKELVRTGGNGSANPSEINISKSKPAPVSTTNRSAIEADEFFADGPLRNQVTTATKAAPKTNAAPADSSFDEPLEVISPDNETITPPTMDEASQIVEGQASEVKADEPTATNSLSEDVQTVEGEIVQSETSDSSLETDLTTEPKVETDSEKIAAQAKNLALSVKMSGWRWPGYYFNLGYFAPLGLVRFYATAPFARTVLIRTHDLTYALTPTDVPRFLTELKLRRNLGATEQLEEGRQAGAFLAHPLWHDWAGRALIILGVLGNLALFIYLLWNFQDFPLNVQIHFDKFGVPDRIDQKGGLMWLPLIGLVAVTVNSVLGAWVQRRDKVPAYLLYIAAIVVQLLIALALAGILGGNVSNGS